MDEVVRLELPAAIPSINRVYGRHWSAKHKQRKQWGWMIRAALLEASSDPAGKTALAALRAHVVSMGRVSVRVETWRPRRIDETNCQAGFKSAEDALKAEGLIVDDHPKWIDRAVRQHIGAPRTVIELRLIRDPIAV